MWNSSFKPTPLTVDSLKTSRNRRLFPKERIPEKIRSRLPDPRLKSGENLPTHRRLFFTPELINVPLDDLDPFYADKETFLIVTEKKFLHRFSGQSSLNIFSPFNPIRRTCISIPDHWIYRWFMIMTAFLDSCLLIQPYNDNHPMIFYFFGTIYTFDFVNNVIARGLIFDQFAFLRDGWGIVDLLLLVPYYISFIGRHHFLCGLRSLKIAALFPSLRSMVKAVITTVGDLRDMFIWTLFTTWIFALVGYHFFKGVSTQTCVRDFPEDGSVGETRDMNWHVWVSNSSNWYDTFRGYSLCGNHSMNRSCQRYGNFTCLSIRDPNDRLYSSMGWALLSTVLIMLQDSWSDIYFTILQSSGPWHAAYFLVTLFLGSFYTLNMILAVVSKSYDDLQKKFKLAEKMERSRNKRSTSNLFCTNDGDIEKNYIHDPDESNQNDSYNRNSINHFWTWITNLLNIIAFGPFTELIMVVATVTNLIILSMDHYGVEENEQLHMILVSGYQVFGIMFAVECLLKFLACSPIFFFKEKWNIFDIWQTVLFLVEYIFEFNTRLMKTLLSLRSIRIFQLTRIWPTLESILNRVYSAVRHVSGITIVAIGVFYMFTVAGVHLFGGNIGTRHPESHWHFRDFWHSFMVIFRLLCGEWAESMSECVEDHGWICIPFFISAVIVLDLIILNLLIVMFVQNFSTKNSSIKNSNGNFKINKAAIAVNRFIRLWMWIKTKFVTCFGRKADRNIQPASGTQEQQTNQVEASVPNKTFCGFPKLRIKMQTIMNSKWFKYINIGNTISVTICLSLRDGHLKSRPLLQVVLNVADNITLLFMAVEAAIKIVAMGFSTYLKNIWNLLDFLILLGGILNIITTFAGYGSVAFFRSMRVFRLFSNFERMGFICKYLQRAVPKLFGILLVCLLIWLVFAIIGVQLLNGRFQYCGNYDDRIIRNKLECLHFNFTWDNLPDNFDNVGSAYMQVLQIITSKGWGYLFDKASSSGEIEEQPSFENSFWISSYFVIVLLFGSFFAFNLFISGLIDGLNEEKGLIEGNIAKYKMGSGHYEARKYMQDKLKRKFSSADKQTDKYQKFIWRVIVSKYFEMVILLNLVFNMVLLSMDQGSPNPHMDILLILNGVCTAVFASECLLNMFALKCTFFRNPCNVFELLTELLTIFDILWTDVALKTTLLSFRPGLLRLIRFAWVSRYLRQLKAADGLRQLLSVLQISLPAFLNICLLLVLVVFLYSTFGMEFFKDGEYGFIKDYEMYFQTLPSFFIFLLPILTSAGWNTFQELTEEARFMNWEANDSFEVPWSYGTVAAAFLISFLLINFLLLVMSAIILENYSKVIKRLECELRVEHFDMFYEVWSQFDTKRSRFIGFNHLCDLFENFEPPFYVSQPNRVAISLMNIPIYEGDMVHCADVMDAAIACFHFRKGVVSSEFFNQYQDEMKQEKSCTLERRSSTFLLQREQRCAIIIQRAWRNQKKIPQQAI